MFKKFIAIILCGIMLSGCTFHVTPILYEKAEDICKNNGGLNRIILCSNGLFDIDYTVICKDGLSRRLTENEETELGL